MVTAVSAKRSVFPNLAAKDANTAWFAVLNLKEMISPAIAVAPIAGPNLSFLGATGLLVDVPSLARFMC